MIATRSERRGAEDSSLRSEWTFPLGITFTRVESLRGSVSLEVGSNRTASKLTPSWTNWSTRCWESLLFGSRNGTAHNGTVNDAVFRQLDTSHRCLASSANAALLASAMLEPRFGDQNALVT